MQKRENTQLKKVLCLHFCSFSEFFINFLAYLYINLYQLLSSPAEILID